MALAPRRRLVCLLGWFPRRRREVVVAAPRASEERAPRRVSGFVE
jgi:hypothetical protein